MEAETYEGVPLRAPTHDEIALRAWCIYEKNPDVHGLDKEHWAQAERQLMERLRRAVMLRDKKKRVEDRNLRWAAYYAAREKGFFGEYEEFVALQEAGEPIPTGPRSNLGEVILDRLGKFLSFLTRK